MVLAHGVFVDSEIRDGEMDPEAISQALMQRREAWQDSARLLGFLVEQLRLKQQRLRNYDRVLGAAQMAIKHVQDSRADSGQSESGDSSDHFIQRSSGWMTARIRSRSSPRFWRLLNRIGRSSTIRPRIRWPTIGSEPLAIIVCRRVFG
ncbi:MAG: hypothetical protein MZV65_30160 [Chromatiales bacterium]|nr:hypothetical protein [Chromatiales bacterium]